MFDLATDPVSQALITEFYNAGKIIAAVCHGPAALAHGPYLSIPRGSQIMNSNAPGFTSRGRVSVLSIPPPVEEEMLTPIPQHSQDLFLPIPPRRPKSNRLLQFRGRRRRAHISYAIQARRRIERSERRQFRESRQGLGRESRGV